MRIQLSIPIYFSEDFPDVSNLHGITARMINSCYGISERVFPANQSAVDLARSRESTNQFEDGSPGSTRMRHAWPGAALTNF